MHSAMLSVSEIAGCPAHDVNLECAPIGAGLCASTCEEEMSRTSKVEYDYKSMYMGVLAFCSCQIHLLWLGIEFLLSNVAVRQFTY